MKQKVYQFSFPLVPAAVMVVFLSAIFFANVNLSFAGSNKKQQSGVERISAVEHTNAQIKELQDALMISEAQNELWNNLTQVMQENAKEMDDLKMDRAEKNKTMNSVERMKFHRLITESHLAQMDKLIPPFEAFYDSMSDEQKETTDTIFLTGKHGRSGRHGKSGKK